MSESTNKHSGSWGRARRRNSLFGPIILIAIGVYFLLNNLDIVSYQINWVAALQLWPLALILIGINVIVRQAPGVLGGFLSALVGLLAVAIFGYVLFFSADDPVLSRFGLTTGTADIQRETIEFAADDVETAVAEIHFGLPSAELRALTDSRNLIEGQVSHAGDLVFDASAAGGAASIILDDQVNAGSWFLNPANWTNFSEEDRWQIGLNPDIPTDLNLDISAGSVSLDLSELTLNRLEVDGGAGSAEVWLPGGEYDVFYDVSAGSTKITLPDFGRHKIEIDGGAGSLALYLPPAMAARVEVDGGAGSFRLNEARFRQVSGDEADEGAWETADYDDAINRIDLLIDVSAGSVRIEDVQGR